MNIINSKSFVEPETTYSYIFTGEEPLRIDMFLASRHQAYSRTFFQQLIDQEHVSINSIKVKRSSKPLKKNDCITVYFPSIQPQITDKIVDPAISISVVYEHEHFLVINKPPYLSVHAPHKKSKDPSLVDWLLYKFEEIRAVGHQDRPGIVHRLDKNTSGLLLVSRNNYAHELLSSLFKNRLIKKTYRAIVKGHPPETGVIDFPISRDPFHRTKMSHKYSTGRSAVTHYKVIEYFKESALMELYPVTGRTHQIRVHCAAIGHPLFGDDLYGSSSKIISRHALHAMALEFSFEEQHFSFIQKLPHDFNDLLDFCRSN